MEKLLELESYFDKNRTSTEEWEIGIDEAGRGPVLGSMVYGACFWPVKLRKDLAAIGFTDSKKLTEEERDKYFAMINEIRGKYLDYDVRILDPEFISNKMLQKDKCSLNKVSHDSAINLIETALDKGINIVHCYLDTVGPMDTYRGLLQDYFKYKYPKVKFTVSEKAELKYPVVAAASICAKVTRDAELKNWKFRENVGDGVSFEFGSGYPGDEKTITWLKKHMDPIFGFPDIVRFSWKTCETLIMEKVTVDYGDQNAQNDNNAKLDSFLAKEKRGNFLTKLGMTNQFTL